MHSGGLASDEIPIIGQRGEFMMSKRGVAANGLSKLQRMNAGESVGGGITIMPGAVVINGDVDSEDRAAKLVTEIAQAIRLNTGGAFQKMTAALGHA